MSLNALLPKLCCIFLVVAVLSLGRSAAAEKPCRINVVDRESGWPVPLVELRTTHNVRFFSDNAGVVAFDLPESMGVETWLSVEGNGYGVPEDGFRLRGVRITPKPGESVTIEVDRQLPGKRLGRITGGGLFAESQKCGLETDWRDQGIFGCDSVQTALHNGRLYWAWGDTTLPKYPLGLFHTLGATTEPRPLASFEPPVRLRFNYFRDDAKQPRVIAKMPGDGPTWITGYVSLKDQNGKQRLGAVYFKVKAPMVVYECGLCVWDEKEQRFKNHKTIWTQTDESSQPPLVPDGHAVFSTDESGAKSVLFGDPFPRLKCAATFEAWSDPEKWEAIEPQKNVESAADGAAIVPHRGSIAYSPFRKKWVAVFTQLYGKPSALGEIWYAEAAAPTGPWKSAVKVVTHANYTFYNPCLHAELTDGDSPILLFEATYTNQFTNHAPATPRHDYNQILYRLDLDAPALVGKSLERQKNAEPRRE